mmetsp:Transcript_8689/g.18928  ORF Transcript_8689/g.18928 Transcript_8689/m.18928 type:complete len:270 (-) Transcript_8689:451-1260(-)
MRCQMSTVGRRRMASPSRSPRSGAERASRRSLEDISNGSPAREHSPRPAPARRRPGRPKKRPPSSVQQPSDAIGGSCATSSLRAALLFRRSARSAVQPSEALATIQPRRKRRQAVGARGEGPLPPLQMRQEGCRPAGAVPAAITACDTVTADAATAANTTAPTAAVATATAAAAATATTAAVASTATGPATSTATGTDADVSRSCAAAAFAELPSRARPVRLNRRTRARRRRAQIDQMSGCPCRASRWRAEVDKGLVHGNVPSTSSASG